MTQREIDFNKIFFSTLNEAKGSGWTREFWQQVLDQPQLSDYEIRQTATNDQKRPDGVLLTPDTIVFIENKTISNTSDGQLVSYAKALSEEYNLPKKYLLLFGPLFNRTRDEINNLKASPFRDKIIFKSFTWDELAKMAEKVSAPDSVISLLKNHSKQTVFDLFDSLIKPIFDKMVKDGRLVEKVIQKRAGKGDLPYHQFHYWMPGTMTRIRVGFDANKISLFTIGWYSVEWNGQSITMGTKLKSDNKDQPDLIKKLEPINQIRRDYPMTDFYDRDMLSPKEFLAWHNQLLEDIRLMYRQILKIINE